TYCNLISSLCGGCDGVCPSRLGTEGERLVPRLDRVECIMHREMHHCGSAHAFQRQQLVFGDGKVEHAFIPRDQHLGTDVGAIVVASASDEDEAEGERDAALHGRLRGWHSVRNLTAGE